MKIVIYITFIISLIFSQLSFAQDGTKDFETWSSLNLGYKLNKKWSFNLEQQLRLKEQSSVIDAYFTELGASYEINEHFIGSIGYRFIRKNDNKGKIQGYENHGRLNFDLEYKATVNRINFGSRLRFQTKNEFGITTEEGDYAKNHLRLKTSVGYNISKWKLDPELSAEIYRNYEKDVQTDFSKFRVTFGTKYKFKKFGKVGVFYRVEKDLNTPEPKTSNIVGLKYTYTLKKK